MKKWGKGTSYRNKKQYIFLGSPEADIFWPVVDKWLKYDSNRRKKLKQGQRPLF